MDSGALFDETGKYRYSLWRLWDTSKSIVAFCMLNPSTANAETDDPTIRRCIGFAKTWGYGGLVVVNLFALVSSDPKVLLKDPDATGGDKNDKMIYNAAFKADKIIAAWGAFPEARERAASVINMLMSLNVYCLGITNDGCPKHPLYIKGDTRPILFRAENRW